MVDLQKVLSHANQMKKVSPKEWHLGKTDETLLKNLIMLHFKWTGSAKAKKILEDWNFSLKKFVKVFPFEYRRALIELNKDSGKDRKLTV